MYWRTMGLDILMGSHIRAWMDSVLGVSHASPINIEPNITADAMERPILWNHLNHSMQVFLGHTGHCWSSHTNPTYMRGDRRCIGDDSGLVKSVSMG